MKKYEIDYKMVVIVVLALVIIVLWFYQGGIPNYVETIRNIIQWFKDLFGVDQGSAPVNPNILHRW